MISVLTRIVDLIAPRLCMMCGRRLAPGEDTLCSVCNLQLPRTGHQSDPYGNEMARMFWGRMPIERCGALFYYKGGSQASHIIYNIKYNDHPEAAEALGRMLAAEYAGCGFFEGIDLIVPLPLSRNRLRQRGYNQSRELAVGLHRATGIAMDSRVVSRVQFDESQTHKQRWDRAANVAHAFRLNHPEHVRGRHVLLVDDIATTGATLCACANTLAQAGDVRVSVFTLGYTRP